MEKNYTRPSTTFHMDFQIAERFGEAAIRDTFRRAHDGWKNSIEYYTELVMCLNHRLWMWYGHGNEPFSRLYDELYWKADAWVQEHFTGDELAYYFEVTD